MHALSQLYQRLKAPTPPIFFSADWYLLQYPDVAVSKTDPWLHFHHHGRHEGRFACEEHLALFFDEYTLEDLQRAWRTDDPKLSVADQGYIDWLIARFQAYKENWQAVIDALSSSHLIDSNSSSTHAPRLLLADAVCRVEQWAQAENLLRGMSGGGLEDTDRQLLAANLAYHHSDPMGWLQAINSIYLKAGCRPIALLDDVMSIDSLTCSELAHDDQGPLVSVLMAARNAANGLDTALSGLLNQTHRNLEVIVVDDASTDETAALVSKWAKRDSRVRLLQNKANEGAYPARNRAIEHARGEFITVHDSDDWSHPQKISMQVRALMENPGLKATLSAWARVSEGLCFGGWETPESWNGWIHPNTSSLMIRRCVHEQLGYWDEVRCSADTEFTHRICAQWGPGSIKHIVPQVPLAFGRVSSGALTRQPETHLMTRLKGVRHDYECAYTNWHSVASSKGGLYLSRAPLSRPFKVADHIQIKDSSD